MDSPSEAATYLSLVFDGSSISIFVHSKTGLPTETFVPKISIGSASDYRPDKDGFVLRNGLFHQFCERARDDEDRKYVFIIDEINRGKHFSHPLSCLEPLPKKHFIYWRIQSLQGTGSWGTTLRINDFFKLH
jgi:hypothetical protein